VLYAHGAFLSRAEDDRLGLPDWSALLAHGRRLVRYEARGHGESTGRATAADYHYPNQGSDLLAIAAEAQPERFEQTVLIISPTAWADRRAQAAAYLAQADQVAQAGRRPCCRL
jgi:3-oxoadipate enol-lactonase